MILKQLERAQNASRMRQMAAWQRIRSQLQFAEFLVTSHPDRAAQFKPALAAAQQAAAEGLAMASADMAATTAAVEHALAPLAETAKAYTVFLAGHAHIDMNWMWSWPETVSVTLDTFRTMLDLLREFPEFHFSQSQASVYRLVEEHDADLLAEIAARVKEGRWEVTASHWVEGDKNLAGGESLCRHLLYTRRYLHALFGLKPEAVAIDWSPDTFGHAATLPAYLARGGVKYLYLHRPGTMQQPVPEAFWWEAPDGSRVLVHNAQRRGYNCGMEPGQVLEAVWASAATAGGLSCSLLVYGVGDHGGGPTRRDLLMRREMDAWPVFPRLVCAASQDYFEALARVADRLPVMRGELNYEFTGCYTTETLIKRCNRLAEARLGDAEMAAAFDTLVRGEPYPAETFERDWRRTLFSQFHDILPGSGVHDTRTYTHGQFQETMASTLAITTRALRGVAGVVDTARVAGPLEVLAVPPAFVSSGQGAGVGIAAAEGRLSQYSGHGDSPARPFVVFNLTAAARREVVTVTIWDREPAGSPVHFTDKAFEALDAAGKALAVQVLEKSGQWGHQSITLAVPVEVPALGFTTFVVRETFEPPEAEAGAWQIGKTHHCAYALRERVAAGLENALVRVLFDAQTGRIVSFTDKRTGLELADAASGGIGLEYSVERPHGMTAWCIENSGKVEFPALKAVRETRNGPHVAAIELTYTVRESTIKVTYRLDRDDPRLHVALDADWFQRGTPETGIPNLRLALPLALTGTTASYEIPFGAVDRATPPDQEVPALRWAKLAGSIEQSRAALLVVNDCKYGHACTGSTLRINLIRSSYDPDPLPEIGHHAMAFALEPVAADLSTAEATRRAQAFAAPLLPVATGVHAGRLAPTTALLDLQGRDVVLSGIKFAEKDKGLIVRLYETVGADAKAAVALAPQVAAPVEACAVDLMERPLKDAAKPALTSRAVKFTVPAFGLFTLWIKTRRTKV